MALPNHHDEEQAPLLTTLARTNSFSGVVDDERIVTTPLAATGMVFVEPYPLRLRSGVIILLCEI